MNRYKSQSGKRCKEPTQDAAETETHKQKDRHTERQKDRETETKGGRKEGLAVVHTMANAHYTTLPHTRMHTATQIHLLTFADTFTDIVHDYQSC